jgi:penicillin amidase
MPPQNFVTGDAMGNIGWTIAGKIPLKTDFDAMLPADWSTEPGWSGWVAGDDYPRVVNPPSGRLWTANSRVTDGEALKIIGNGGYDLGARTRQIRDRLFAKEMFTASDMLAIQYDDRALFLTPWRNLLIELLDDKSVAEDEALLEYREILRNWIPRAAPDAVGYRLVRAFRHEIEKRMFFALTAPVREAYGDDVGLQLSNQFEAALWSLVTERPMHMLPGSFDDWDQFLMDAVRTNIQYFAENYDDGLSKRSWGEFNVAEIRHPLSGSIPFIGQYLNMPQDPLSGDSDMPKAQGSTWGASERFSVMPGDEANGLLQMPGGASGHPLSPFYAAGHSDWVDGLPSPFLPGTPTHRLTLIPDRL